MNLGDSDAGLMLRVKRGDRDAFRQLVERHQRAVINMIYRAIGDQWEAEDLAQRVFVQVYRAAPRYQPTAKFTTWLFTITHNLIRNEHRRRARHKAESLDRLTQPDQFDEMPQPMADTQVQDPSSETIRRELQTAIHAAVRALPDRQRTVVILCRFEGLSYEEIAEVLNCSVSSVKSLLHRARQTLKEQLKGWY